MATSAHVKVEEMVAPSDFSHFLVVNVNTFKAPLENHRTSDSSENFLEMVALILNCESLQVESMFHEWGCLPNDHKNISKTFSRCNSNVQAADSIQNVIKTFDLWVRLSMNNEGGKNSPISHDERIIRELKQENTNGVEFINMEPFADAAFDDDLSSTASPLTSSSECISNLGDLVDNFPDQDDFVTNKIGEKRPTFELPSEDNCKDEGLEYTCLELLSTTTKMLTSFWPTTNLKSFLITVWGNWHFQEFLEGKANCELPSFCREWCDIKVIYRECIDVLPSDVTMPKVMATLGISEEPSSHSSSIAECIHIAKIAARLLSIRANFRPTFSLEIDRQVSSAGAETKRSHTSFPLKPSDETVNASDAPELNSTVEVIDSSPTVDNSVDETQVLVGSVADGSKTTRDQNSILQSTTPTSECVIPSSCGNGTSSRKSCDDKGSENTFVNETSLNESESCPQNKDQPSSSDVSGAQSLVSKSNFVACSQASGPSVDEGKICVTIRAKNAEELRQATPHFDQLSHGALVMPFSSIQKYHVPRGAAYGPLLNSVELDPRSSLYGAPYVNMNYMSSTAARVLAPSLPRYNIHLPVGSSAPDTDYSTGVSSLSGSSAASFCHGFDVKSSSCSYLRDSAAANTCRYVTPTAADASIPVSSSAYTATATLNVPSIKKDTGNSENATSNTESSVPCHDPENHANVADLKDVQQKLEQVTSELNAVRVLLQQNQGYQELQQYQMQQFLRQQQLQQMHEHFFYQQQMQMVRSNAPQPLYYPNKHYNAVNQVNQQNFLGYPIFQYQALPMPVVQHLIPFKPSTASTPVSVEALRAAGDMYSFVPSLPASSSANLHVVRSESSLGVLAVSNNTNSPIITNIFSTSSSGYPTLTPGTTTSSSGYPTLTPGTTTSSSGYPTLTPGTTTSSSGYPTLTPGTTTSSSGYPTLTPGTTTSSSGYPTSTPGTTTSSSGYPTLTPGTTTSSSGYPTLTSGSSTSSSVFSNTTSDYSAATNGFTTASVGSARENSAAPADTFSFSSLISGSFADTTPSSTATFNSSTSTFGSSNATSESLTKFFGTAFASDGFPTSSTSSSLSSYEYFDRTPGASVRDVSLHLDISASSSRASTASKTEPISSSTRQPLLPSPRARSAVSESCSSTSPGPIPKPRKSHAIATNKSLYVYEQAWPFRRFSVDAAHDDASEDIVHEQHIDRMSKQLPHPTIPGLFIDNPHYDKSQKKKSTPSKDL